VRGRCVISLAAVCLLAFEGWALAQDAGAGDAAQADAAPRDGALSDANEGPTPDPIPPDRLPVVETSLGAEAVEIGEVLSLVVSISHDEGGDRSHLRGVERLGGFEVIERQRSEAAAAGEPERIELSLMAFEAGEHEIPPFEIMVVLTDGRTGSVRTNAHQVRVTDPLANEPDPQVRSDHSPLDVLTTDRRALWAFGILVGLLAAALLGLAIERYRRRRARRPDAGPPPPPPRPAEEVALEKLDALASSDLLETDRIKEFHVGVSESVREYFGGRYDFDSLELTTEELVAELDKVTMRGISREEAIVFLGETDLVKFAKWRPDVDHSRSLLDKAYDIVRRTTAAEVLMNQEGGRRGSA